MSVSPQTESFMENEWTAAVADSGLDPDLLHLLPVPGAPPPNAFKAACYPPRRRLFAEDLFEGADLTLAEANSSGVRDKHRIAIYEDVDELNALELAIMAAKLRHEIRHAEQRIACGNVLFEFEDLLQEALSWKVGGLGGGAVFYQFTPVEMDCNSAAARFLRARHPEAIKAILVSDDGPLARSNTEPGPLQDLPAKTVACLFCFREIVEDPDHLPPRMTFEEHLARVSSAAARQWAEMAAATG